MERPKVKDYDNISGAGAYDYVADINRYMDYLEQKVEWVLISEQMPPLHNYVILINESGYMIIEFIHQYDLTTEKYPKNYTHWANLPEKPKQ